jgi:hypothetical protein
MMAASQTAKSSQAKAGKAKKVTVLARADKLRKAVTEVPKTLTHSQQSR